MLVKGGHDVLVIIATVSSQAFSPSEFRQASSRTSLSLYPWGYDLFFMCFADWFVLVS